MNAKTPACAEVYDARTRAPLGRIAPLLPSPNLTVPLSSFTTKAGSVPLDWSSAATWCHVTPEVPRTSTLTLPGLTGAYRNWNAWLGCPLLSEPVKRWEQSRPSISSRIRTVSPLAYWCRALRLRGDIQKRSLTTRCSLPISHQRTPYGAGWPFCARSSAKSVPPLGLLPPRPSAGEFMYSTQSAASLGVPVTKGTI